jgi:hypothetical protein
MCDSGASIEIAEARFVSGRRPAHLSRSIACPFDSEPTGRCLQLHRTREKTVKTAGM